MAPSGRAALGGEPFQSTIEARSACGGFPGGGRVGADDRAGATTGTLAAASRSAFGRPRHGRGPARHFATACLGRTGRYRALRRRAADHAEEHTSELQSHSDLVCRLLLEKKKNKSS